LIYEIYHLTYEYREGIRALEDVSLKISDEPLLILGHNGAGKTTLLKILAFLLRPKEGKLIFKGKDVNSISKVELLNFRREVSYIPQRVTVFNGSLYEDIEYGLKIRGIKDSSDRIKEALKEVGLEGLENRRAKELSGGQMRKLAIARALAIDPDILLFDEPTSELDSYELLEKIIFKKFKEGKKIIIATTDLSFAKRLKFKAILLAKGKVIKYLNAFDSL